MPNDNEKRHRAKAPADLRRLGPDGYGDPSSFQPVRTERPVQGVL